MGGDGQHEEGESLGVTGALGLPAASSRPGSASGLLRASCMETLSTRDQPSPRPPRLADPSLLLLLSPASPRPDSWMARPEAELP